MGFIFNVFRFLRKIQTCLMLQELLLINLGLLVKVVFLGLTEFCGTLLCLKPLKEIQSAALNNLFRRQKGQYNPLAYG